MSEHKIVSVQGMTNEEFLRNYAAPGRVGLSGGSSWIDRAIRAAERRIDDNHEWGRFSHVFLCQGTRVDGHHWVMESDLQLIRKHVTLGVQENRMSKYHDEELYHTLAIMDFGLPEHKTNMVLRMGLELVATKTRYSIRELFGAWASLLHPDNRSGPNKLSREHSLYCSAFVQHLYKHIEIELAPGVADKNTTPEDIFRSPAAQTVYLLERPRKPTVLVKAAKAIGDRIRDRARRRERSRKG